jgi:hypothetical protein
MQIQMEVCDLDLCDFVETRIKEYPGKESFLNDTVNDCKGVVLTFVSSDYLNYKSFYEYKIGNDLVDEWIQTKEEEHSEKYYLDKTDYWWLDQYSCVLVQRNKQWFDAAIEKVKSLWEIVEKERISGHEHRAPKKRAPKLLVNLTKLE